jgi:hypothetical protein
MRQAWGRKAPGRGTMKALTISVLRPARLSHPPTDAVSHVHAPELIRLANDRGQRYALVLEQAVLNLACARQRPVPTSTLRPRASRRCTHRARCGTRRW